MAARNCRRLTELMQRIRTHRPEREQQMDQVLHVRHAVAVGVGGAGVAGADVGRSDRTGRGVPDALGERGRRRGPLWSL